MKYNMNKSIFPYRIQPMKTQFDYEVFLQINHGTVSGDV